MASTEKLEAPPIEQTRFGAFVVEDVTDKRNGGGTITIGKAYRRRPMIDVLADQGLFSQAEHKALRHYRHHADIADRSLVRDSLARAMPHCGTGDGPTVNTLNAIRLVADVEAAAGSLAGILRAVAVYDVSLSQVAIDRAGGIEECYTRNGSTICQIKPRRRALEIARLEMQVAAQRVQAELDA